MGQSIGAVELSSVGIGYKVQDEMLKAASIEILIARTICSGKYLIVFTGSVSDVEAAIETGLKTGDSAIIDHLTVANVFEGVFPAMTQSVVVPPENIDALGIIETFSGVSALLAADYAGKAANVTLFRLHIAMALGGKGLLMMTGSVSDVTAAVQVAADTVRQRGLLVCELVIPRPSKELLNDYI
ncbi:MAG: BMC domain-containing protein [Planctomycetaceae bacterium]|jgi:microcompartment protein CcmL/EutN|nr:BMC domain-containing protein [Planctomycetaceae bacterium]